MRANFSPEQLADPDFASSANAIGKCVHCGFCTATCPTYVLLGDELDLPRGRIRLIKDMLDNERAPSASVVKHIDRCLSCLACVTTCPSGVNYMHLIDHARAYVAKRFRRPLLDRIYRALIANVLPFPNRLSVAVGLAGLARPLAPLLQKSATLRPLAAMIDVAQQRIKTAPVTNAASPSRGARRVVLLKGCAEQVVRPNLRDAATRLLNRASIEIVEAPGEQCCGALVYHLGMEDAGLRAARHNIDRWIDAIDLHGVEAVVVTASGCGSMIKNYHHLFRNDPDYAEKARRVSALAKDVTELLTPDDLKSAVTPRLRPKVAYHAACSLQHGQKITAQPASLLAAAGYEVAFPEEGHLCCGSAGAYSILQSEIAGQLRDRKAAALRKTGAAVVAAGNIGCITHIAQSADQPVLHTVELLDWATGGPLPAALGEARVKS